MIKEFKIARIRILVEAPYELIANGGYVLYQVGLQEKSGCLTSGIGADLWVRNNQKETCEKNEFCDSYEIRMVKDATFPKMKGRVLFQDEMNLYLETKGDEILHLFHIPMTRFVAAWCETTSRHSLTIHYREEASDYFRGAVGCFNAAAIENILYAYKKFLFHCSYVDVEGEAVLFSAHSGGGKTTHALLWEQCGLGEMINGDRAVIEKIQNDIEERGKHSRENRYGYVVHGLPIAGSSDVFKNRSLPLRAIFMLEKAPINEVIEISPLKRFLQIFEQITIHTWDREFVSVAANFVEELVKTVPVMLIRCRPDEDAVKVVREALNVL